MKPKILEGLSPEQEREYVRAVWSDFRHTEAYALLLWWLEDLHRQARAVYLSPDVTEVQRLMHLGQEQVLERLHEHFGEIFTTPRPAPPEDLDLEPAVIPAEEF